MSAKTNNNLTLNNSQNSQLNRVLTNIFEQLDRLDSEMEQIRIEQLARYSDIQLFAMMRNDPLLESYIGKELERRGWRFPATQNESANGTVRDV